MGKSKPRYPFWCIENNYVINVNNIAWFQIHTDGTLTVCLTTKGPHGTDQIQVSDKAAIADFNALIAVPTK